MAAAIELTDQYPELLPQLATRVRHLRTAKGLSRKTLSRLAAISERHLAQLESGKGNISIALLARVAAALQISLAHLFAAADGQTQEQQLINELVSALPAAQQQLALQLLHARFSQPKAERQRLALIGLRGAGKTTLGQRLAEQRQLPFVQLVEVIEQLAGMNVSEIFSLSGEAYYRKLEQRALMETLSRYSACVIEAGGSLVTDQEQLNMLLNTSLVVWVQARAEEHMQRVIDQGDLRPMADRDDAMSDLRRILREREPFYRQAHAVINTSGQTIESSLREVMHHFPVRENSNA